MSRLPDWARRGRGLWSHVGAGRPDFAVEPGPGQESVWDYPRPPRLVRDERVVEVRHGEHLVARTTRALRLLETASPPTFYLPVDDVEIGMLTRAPGHSRCEWKGEASYWDVGPAEDQVARAAWSYEQPFADYSVLAGHLSFYPALLLCTVAGEAVRPQPGGFYGGWVTDDVVGPFKGEPGTGAW